MGEQARGDSGILIAAVLANVWLAHSGPRDGALPGILPYLTLLALLAPFFRRTLERGGPDAGGRYVALLAVAGVGLMPSHARVLADPGEVAFLWSLAGMVAGLLLYEAMPAWRRYGVFLVPVAAGWWCDPAAAMFLPLLGMHLLLRILLGRVAPGDAGWRRVRPCLLGVLWFLMMRVALPARPLAADLGAALAVGGAVAWLVDSLAGIRRWAVLAGCTVPLVLGAVAIARQGAADFERARWGARAASASAEALLGQSLVHFQAGRYREAITAAEAALRVKPGYAEAYNNIGASYAALELWDPAIEAAERALRLKPDFVLARNNLAWATEQKTRATR